jgi:hypothetical protein
VARRRQRRRPHARPARPRPGPLQRARADPRGAESGRAGPAGKERLDPRGPDQVPRAGAAPVRHGAGRGRRPARRARRPGAAVGVRAGGLPGGAGAGRGAAQLAARRRAQHLPAARGSAVRHARAAVPERAHARAGARDRYAAHDARGCRAGARRGPSAARGRAGRSRPARARRAGRARRARRAHAHRLARGSGGRGAGGADRRPSRVGDQRTRGVREDVGAGRGGPGVGRGRAPPGDRHHAVPVGPQHPGRRSPRVLQQRPVPGPPARPARRPRRRGAPARRPCPDRRGLYGRHPGPGRRRHPGGLGRRQGDPGRRYPAATGGGKRGRHVAARRRARLRPAHRTGPVPRRLGTGGQPAAPRRRHQRAGRVQPARTYLRRQARADDGRRRSRLPRADPGRGGHAADGRGPRAAPRTEPPRPRGPHHPRRRLRRARGEDRRRRPGQRRGT